MPCTSVVSNKEEAHYYWLYIEHYFEYLEATQSHVQIFWCTLFQTKADMVSSNFYEWQLLIYDLENMV